MIAAGERCDEAPAKITCEELYDVGERWPESMINLPMLQPQLTQYPLDY